MFTRNKMDTYFENTCDIKTVRGEKGSSPIANRLNCDREFLLKILEENPELSEGYNLTMTDFGYDGGEWKTAFEFVHDNTGVGQKLTEVFQFFGLSPVIVEGA